jgi:hypothetical protein
MQEEQEDARGAGGCKKKKSGSVSKL